MTGAVTMISSVNRDSNTYSDRDSDSDGDCASVSAVTISLG